MKSINVAHIPQWISKLSLLLLLTLIFKQASADNLPIDYQQNVQPIFDRYCVACHACFDAPCQLNLGSYEGLERGASKTPVYEGARLEKNPPTRLFIDATSMGAWRQKGFFPVIDAQNPAQSTLLKLINQKHQQPLSPTEPFPKQANFGINRDHACPTPSETSAFLTKNVHLGMPFFFPGMDDRELKTIVQWLSQGAKGSITSQIPTQDLSDIEKWETWLNHNSLERKLLARWLFEHWQYAHLYFADNNSINNIKNNTDNRSNRFYRLTRSRTPQGQAIDEIATRRANSDPEQAFYYRFKLVTDTLVYKTHITFPLTNEELEYLKTQFSGYTVTQLPGYSEAEQANPFTTFAALPAKAKYEFMLKHAEYFVRTFIRGPVCRGMLATDVIRDHFWVAFQAPEKDPFIHNAQYRHEVAPLLTLPSIEDDFLGSTTQWFDSSFDRNEYIRKRQKAIQLTDPEGVGLDIIWQGNNTNKSALLTIFRHHDSATVKTGWLGQKPLTTWLLDFPLFEQSYYNLVVNFDVFGNLAHQSQTRLYFDFIRNGAEINFLSLLPAEDRKKTLNHWYQGSAQLKLWTSYEPINTHNTSTVTYKTEQPYRELLSILLDRLRHVNATPDPINRPNGKVLNATEHAFSLLSGKKAPALPVVSNLPEASLILLESADGNVDVYTLIRNRRHTNVAFILGESWRYQPDLDELTIVKGIATAYPNLLFYIPKDMLNQFVEDMQQLELGKEAVYQSQILQKWAISRRQANFWDFFHLTTDYLKRQAPIESSLLDLNRYEPY